MNPKKMSKESIPPTPLQSRETRMGDYISANELGEKDLGCPECGAQPGQQCNFLIEGRTTEISGIIHTARIENAVTSPNH